MLLTIVAGYVSSQPEMPDSPVDGREDRTVVSSHASERLPDPAILPGYALSRLRTGMIYPIKSFHSDLLYLV